MSFLRKYHSLRAKKRIVAEDYPNWVLKHKNSSYVISAILSFPPWANREDLKKIDAEARRLTKETGVQHEVDHIIPIRHPLVCGLTVPENLQILPQRKNGQKGNYWHPDIENDWEQLDMLGSLVGEQFKLEL